MECAVFVVKIQDGTGLYRVSWTNLCTTGFLMPASTDLVASIKKGNTGNAMLVAATVDMMPWSSHATGSVHGIMWAFDMNLWLARLNG